MVDEHLLRFNKKQKFLLYDYETCNLNLVWEENLPWELAWRLCTLDDVLETSNMLINWEKVGRKLNVGDGAAMVTGFYAKQPKLMMKGLHPKDALEEFDEHLYNPEIIPVAHNGLGFDVYIHNIHRRLVGKPTDYSYIKRFLDTNVVARAMKMGLPFPKNREDLISLQYKMYGNPVRGMKTSIRALCGDFEIPYDETKAHDAEYDVGLLHQILKQILYKVEI